MNPKYSVRYEVEAQKSLKKMDRFQAKLILNWIEENLKGTENPRIHGKELVGDRKEVWRYQAGKYRILADISEDEVFILILTIDHRKQIYKRK
ncbi:type II toxin-antitoxin system RelE family toxin [Enterococcus timonensis]|uniref:type II toxin-antitoxin system RelE family toxin n=1 Tax=Enterococcus timonensis TaxID=1852364 RepID=UPI0008DA97E3|nr:type II toxin-antitoxin system RelE/ParE family toxin [Enterococcus timonensis]